MTHETPDQRRMEECRKACHHCALACTQALRFLMHDGTDPMDTHVWLSLQVCADLCELSAKTLALGSDLHFHLCGACVSVATVCADEVDRQPPNEVLRNCSEMCRRCADSCEEMAKHVAPSKRIENAAHVPH